jgi:hypothetical protein
MKQYKVKSRSCDRNSCVVFRFRLATYLTCLVTGTSECICTGQYCIGVQYQTARRVYTYHGHIVIRDEHAVTVLGLLRRRNGGDVHRQYNCVNPSLVKCCSYTSTCLGVKLLNHRQHKGREENKQDGTKRVGNDTGACRVSLCCEWSNKAITVPLHPYNQRPARMQWR